MIANRFLGMVALAFAFPVFAVQTLALENLLRLGIAENPSVLAARDQVDVARGGASVARAYPNPEITGQSGSANERNVLNPVSGSVYSLGINQPIENPMVRGARIDAAEADLRATDAGRQSFENEIAARIKLAYYELLRREAEETIALEDFQLTQQIRDRTAVRHQVGESPKFDLITAETELLNAQKNRDSAALRTLQARANLRLAVGRPVPADADISGDLPSSVILPPLAVLQQEMATRNPELRRGESEQSASEYRVDLEKNQRLPKFALIAQHDVDPTLSTTRAGIAVTIPIWDFRSGQIAQAKAELARSRNIAASQRLLLDESLELAYRRYQTASRQVAMQETQLLAQASEARRIAEAAYRYGERGILEWLDAQRTYRTARIELIAARYDLASAVVEIDRLRSEPPLLP